MDRQTRVFAVVGGVNAGLAVLLGAFGAHALSETLTPELMDTFETAVDYHFYHALGLVAVAFVGSQMQDSSRVRWAGWLMVLGIVLFSGSLYALCLTGQPMLGAITPLGGVSFVAAWTLLVVGLVMD